MVKWGTSAGLLLTAVVLSVLTMIFSSIPLLMFRRRVGGRAYWLWGGLVASLLGLTGQPQFWSPFLAVMVMIGLYAELEGRHFGIESSGLISLLGASGVIGVIAAAIIRLHDIEIAGWIKGRVSEMVAQMNVIQPGMKLDVNALVPQVPSAIVVILIISLWAALLVDRKTSQSISQEHGTPDLAGFYVPDVFMWFMLLSVVGAFFEFNRPVIQIAGTNALNILIVLYFLQGLAVIGTFFRVQKVGPIWRSFGYFILIGQLFLLVGIIGFIDYWLDFRKRLLKKSAESIGEV